MKKGRLLPTILTYFFILVMLIYFISIGNYEFIGYAVVVGLLYYVLLLADKKYDFPLISIWLFSIWIVSHFLGGAVYIGEIRLYDFILMNIYDGTHISSELVLLKYDQLIHLYCYFTISILVYYMLKYHFKKDQKWSLVIFTILAAIGIGVLNEVIEFAMVLFAGAAEAVGGYYNTALDLVFNLVGAILGVFFSKSFLDK